MTINYTDINQSEPLNSRNFAVFIIILFKIKKKPLCQYDK